MLGKGKLLLKRSLRWQVVAGLVCLLLVPLIIVATGCGGGGGEQRQPKLSGTVTAPQGTPVAAAPSFWQRLSAWFISVAEAQALQGQAVPNATVKAYIWSLNLDLSKPVATTNTNSDGRYTLLLPPEAAGKDIVVIVEKQVQGGTIRLSAIAPDVPPEGKTGVDIDAATTLAAEQIAKFAKDNQISDLSSNGISAVIWEVRKFLENVPMLNLVVGALGSPLPQNFGDGLQGLLQETVQNIVQNQEGNLKPATGDVAVAKSIVQMLRDFGLTLKGIGDNEVLVIQKAIEEQQKVISNEIKVTEAFSKRMDFPMRVIEALKEKSPGAYDEVSYGKLVRVGNTDNKTWKVTSRVGDTQGMVLTIIASSPMDAFEIAPVGSYTLTVRKENDPSVQYDGNLQFSNNAQGIPTAANLNITIKDGDLNKPISFKGSVSGTVAPESTQELPQYSKLSFSGTLSSQFGTARVERLEVTMTKIGEEQQPQLITLTNLQVATQTSKPSSLIVSGRVELEPAPQSWLQQGWEGTMKPKSALISTTLQGSGITVKLSNAQISDFVLDEGDALPRKLEGQLVYTSPSLTFQGTANLFYEGLGTTAPSEQVKLNFTLNGDWKPSVGSPLNVSVKLESTSQTLSMNVSLKYGEQKLEGTLTGNWVYVGEEAEIESATMKLTHSPSNFKVEVTIQEGQPATGTIKTPQGQKVADIGEARNLGLPDLGDALIVKYTDGTFETLESVLPRSRLGKK
jgi:hypothetical protein